MKIKKEYPILIAVIIALGAYLYLKPSDRMQYTLPDIPAIERADINKIEIIRPGEDPIVLEKKDETWRVGENAYPADATKVDSMLNTLADFSVTDLVSESKAFERFELDKEKGIRIKAFTGADLVREFDMGKTAASFRHTYVKLAKEDAIYQAAGNFKRSFDLSLDAIRNKTVTDFPVEAIRSITALRETETVTFTRTEKEAAGAAEKTSEKAEETTDTPPAPVIVWKRTDGEETPDADMQSFLAKLNKIKCQRFETNPADGAYANPVYRFELTDTDKKTYTLSVFEKLSEDVNDYPATSTMAMEPFILSRWELNQILDKLPAPNAPKAEEKTTES